MLPVSSEKPGSQSSLKSKREGYFRSMSRDYHQLPDDKQILDSRKHSSEYPSCFLVCWVGEDRFRTMQLKILRRAHCQLVHRLLSNSNGCKISVFPLSQGSISKNTWWKDNSCSLDYVMFSLESWNPNVFRQLCSIEIRWPFAKILSNFQ